MPDNIRKKIINQITLFFNICFKKQSIVVAAIIIIEQILSLSSNIMIVIDNISSFPIDLLYHIFTKYREIYPVENNYDAKELENEKKIIEFMFKQLDKK